MTRRVLLIDADTEFRDLLSAQLGRYGFAVETEVEPDQALSSALSDQPDVFIIAVEEPDKAGFKTFQKARKTLPAKLPIVLVTATMSPDSFAKHRNLKVHADEYIDKRGLNIEELIGKIDNLIGLGEPSDDLPIAVDDIPMELAEGDVVLDEQEDEPAGDFDAHSAATVGPSSSVTVDQMVAAETDAAFDALLGDEAPAAAKLPGVSDFDNARDRVTSLGDEPEESAIPEPVPHKIPDEDLPDVPDVPAAASPEVDSIPSPIVDGKRKDADFASEEPVHVSAPIDDSVPEPIETPNPDVVSEEASARDSLTSIPLVDDDLVALDDDALEEVEEEVEEAAVEASAPVPTPIAAGHVDREAEPVREPSGALPSIAKEPSGATREPSGAIPRITREGSGATREPSGAIPRLVAKEPSTPAAETTITREPVIPDAALREGAPRARTPSQSSIDLGLDKLAQDAETEQSGVYDRKSLRKIGELERQIAQLKTELERARAAAESADKGSSRESQFLKLREEKLAKDTELRQVKTKLDNQSKELAEAQEKLRQTIESNTSLEARTSELEEQLSDYIGKSKELASSLKAATSQAAELEQDLEAKAKAAEHAQAALAQAEKDLANERATRAASASESERNLRRERDQLLARHKGEIAALRAETEAATEFALSRLREELDAERMSAVTEAIADTKRQAADEQAAALAQQQDKHNGALIEIRKQHAGELSAQKNELDLQMEGIRSELAGLRAEHAEALATAQAEHAAEIERIKAAHDEEIDSRNKARAEAFADARNQLERVMAEHEQKLVEVAAAHVEEKAALEQEHRQQIAELRSRNDQEVAQLVESAKKQIETHKAEVEDEKAKYTTMLAGAQETSDRAMSELRQQLAAAEQKLEHEVARLGAEREALEAEHAKAIAELQAKLDAEHKRAIQTLKAEADRMLRQLEEERDRSIEELRAERDELEKGLSGARESLQKSQSELASAVNTIADRNAEVRAHAAAIAERDQRIAELRKEIESLEQENANYQEQVLRAYQKIKSDEAMVARARKAMAIALTVLDDQGNPTSSS